jgi:hypothetical protein
VSDSSSGDDSIGAMRRKSMAFIGASFGHFNKTAGKPAR